MAKSSKRNGNDFPRNLSEESRLHSATKKSIVAIVFIGLALVLVLAQFGKAGPAGIYIYKGLEALLGAGYVALPATLLFAAGILLFAEGPRIVTTTSIGVSLSFLTLLGLIEIALPGKGGWVGLLFGSLRVPFGNLAATILNSVFLIVGILIALNAPLDFSRFRSKTKKEIEVGDAIIEPEEEEENENRDEDSNEKLKAKSLKLKADAEDEEDADIVIAEPARMPAPKGKPVKQVVHINYTPPPLSLLSSGTEKPTTGDLRANANIIKRTLESFGISVEMGEINIGPKVTRYTLKPAEGVKLSRIVALNQDLALALAAHPIRIEAPIPGKSLVGIEVPNKAAALVRLSSLMGYPDFQSSGMLSFAIGRDVTGEPIFGNIEKMPHLLIAGATGSGKSVTIHSLILSLLFKNSPATLKMIMIDPKRVELSIYEHIPHLISPVITENKKAIGVFRWAISEMDRRYDLLLKGGSRDIKSYNNSHKEEALPYLVIVVDELADLMTSYGKEVEGSIVRLAQMARATGIHLVLSTQRPSVEVITGLIKANITSRVALQVASQIDSRTILDTSGAEKLLGGGDLLFVSAELSKPKRIQGCYVTEAEINAVADFIRDNNEVEPPADIQVGPKEGPSAPIDNSVDFDSYATEGDDDEMLDEATAVVFESKRASASLLQRRLKVGYARAARLLDLMEAQGLIGPGDGAKPREVYFEKFPQNNESIT
ncbi:MAG: DNA translocase FtsK [Candidatus Liptonbacteria bacterium]|nr:DNA translocase FtsK [Candidatus Liptonbacteria bacterium]